MFSFRDEFGQWDPKNQRPEIWNLYNGRVHPGQSIRVFPLSNWTELDIWTYIAEEQIEIPELYLAAEREVVERGGMLYAVNEFTPLRDGETPRTAVRPLPDGRRRQPHRGRRVRRRHRRRRSSSEIATVRITERGATRGDDKVSETVDGRPQEGRLLLMPMRPAPVRDRRVRRRRQEHPHRPAAVRLASRCSATSSRPSSAVSRDRGNDYTDLALLTDGLRAEREQGITIDVAYRYFATPRRKFIIADTPGHIQYTRNMVTGASTADVALILVDARKGITEQSRRHAFLATLLGVPAPRRVRQQDGPRRLRPRTCSSRSATSSASSPTRLRVRDLTFIPVSALKGDNVVDPLARACPGTTGSPLLRHLERLHVARDRNLVDVRFPVQYVIRPQSATRSSTTAATPGTVASGVLKPGDRGRRAAERASSPTIADDRHGRRPGRRGVPADGGHDRCSPTSIDISRGDMLCRPHNMPTVAQDIDAQVCWMDETAPLQPGRKYAIKHTTRWARAMVRELSYRIDVNTLHRDEDGDRAVAQRDRPGPAAGHAAAVRRPVPAEPPDRLVHPRRRGDEQDGRRRDDRADAPRGLISAAELPEAAASALTVLAQRAEGRIARRSARPASRISPGPPQVRRPARPASSSSRRAPKRSPGEQRTASRARRPRLRDDANGAPARARMRANGRVAPCVGARPASDPPNEGGPADDRHER